jgi:hypothetical protein
MTFLAPKARATEIATVPDAEVAPRITQVKFGGRFVVLEHNAIQDDMAGLSSAAAFMGSRPAGMGNMADLGTLINSDIEPPVCIVLIQTISPDGIVPTRSTPGMWGSVVEV